MSTMPATTVRTMNTPFSALLRAELRKVHVSRRFLVVSSVMLALLTAAVVFIQRHGEGKIGYASVLSAMCALLWVLTPLISAQIACTDFASGEVQTWFVLEPRRWRVALAKLVCAVAINAPLILVIYAFGLVLTLSAGGLTRRGTDLTTDLGDTAVLGACVAIIGAVMGVVWGLLLQKFGLTSILIISQATALNLVLPFVAEQWGPYLSSSSILGMFSGESSVAQGLCSTLIWCIMPLLGGIYRVSHQHI